MRYLKSYQLFESVDITEWVDIKELINGLADTLDFEFKELKTTPDSSIGGNKIISFVFKSPKFITPLYKEEDDVFKWFIQQIVNIGSFVYTNKQWNEVIRLKDDFRVDSHYYSGKHASFKYQTDLIVYKKGVNDFHYHFNFKCEVFSLLDWVIKNPDDKDLLKASDVDLVIKNLFQNYCKWSFYDFDFNILSVFADKTDKLVKPVKKRDIQLPYNLSDQFIIDITPVFLKKVFNSSGLVFRLKISRYDESGVTNPDRLRGHSIAQETDEKLKELGLDMTWKDIFIIEN